MGRHLVGEEVLVDGVKVELLEPGHLSLHIKEGQLCLAPKIVALATSAT
jgi:hypothetical protein